MGRSNKSLLLGVLCILCTLTSFAQNATVIFKPHPVFQRYPAELIKETKYDMIRSERLLPGDSLAFSLPVTDPEGEYYKLYGWGALNIFVKPGSVIIIDYNNREREKSTFSGDLAEENAWLNQDWFLGYGMLYPGQFTPETTYKEYRRQVYFNADSLKRVVKNTFHPGKFVNDCCLRVDFMAVHTLLNYYQNLVQRRQSEYSPADFEAWHAGFKNTSFSREFLKNARKLYKRYKEQDVLQYIQVSRLLANIVHDIEPDFAKQIGYTLFEEEYALMQVLNDVTRLYSLELLEFRERVKDPVVSRLVEEHVADKRNLLAGMEAMDFEFEDAGGNLHKLSDYKGTPMFIDVWATWCNPCKALAPVFHELARQYEGKNIKFVAVSIDKKAAPWKSYLNAHPHAGNVLEWHAVNKKFQEAYRISGIPRFILIDKNFKIRMAFAYRPGMKELATLLDKICWE